MIREAVQAITTWWRVRVGERHLSAGWKCWAPAGLVATAVLFNLVVLHAEITQVPNLNDGVLHSTMMRVALHDIDQGKLPLGGWFPYLSLGSAQFLHYQSFPHVIGALMSTIFGTSNVYYWSLYLLLALWPVSVYAGARLLGWDRWIAAIAALVSPLLVSVAGYGYQDTSYTWSGYGLWTQLWGMWLLPLAWGLSWRAVNHGRNYALAALAIALTIACHFLTGYLALMVLVPWVLCDLSQLRRRLVRAVVVGGGALLIASWVLVPLLSEAAWSGNLEYYKGTFYFDSYGAPQVLNWLFTGQLYDSGRFPILSLLVGVGLIVCIVRMRRDTRARAVVAAWALSLVLYFGRPTLGPLLNILPGSSDLPLHRYIAGVHLAGLVLAGVGAWWLVGLLLAGLRRARPRLHATAAAAGIAVAGVALLYPAWTQLASFGGNATDLISAQQQADATDGADLAVLINQVKAAGDGRAYAGSRANWGHLYTIGSRPVYFELENANVDAIGAWLNTESISSDPEAHFDERNLADYDLFNIKYLILPQDHPPPVPAYLLARSGRHMLWEVDTSGYLEVVDTVAPAIAADRTDIGPQMAGFMESNDLQQLRFPTVAFDGAAAASPTLDNAGTSAGPAGTVTTQTAALEDGVFSAEVTANRRAVVLLKTSFEPGWQVSVDGVSAQPIMVAPSLVGVAVPPGSHSVVFRFATYPYYAPLLALGLLAFLMLVFVPRRLGARASGVVAEPAASGKPAARKTPSRRAGALQGIKSWRWHWRPPRTTRFGVKSPPDGPAANEKPVWRVGALLPIGRWRPPRSTRFAVGSLAIAAVLSLVVVGVVTSIWLAVSALLLVAGTLTAGSVPRIDLRIEERVLIGVVVTVLVGSVITYLLTLLAALSIATVLGGSALMVVGFGALSGRRRAAVATSWREGWAELMSPDRRRHRIGLGMTAVVSVLVFSVLFAHTLGTDAAGNLNAGFATVWSDWSQHLTTTSSFAVAHNLPPQNPIFAGQDLRYPFLPDFQSATLMTLGASPAMALAVPGALLAVCIVLLIAALAVRLGAGWGAGVLAAAICLVGGGLGFIGILADACVQHGFSATQCTWSGLVTHPGDIPGIVAGTLHDLPGLVVAQPRAYDGLLTPTALQPLPNQQWYTPLFSWWLPQRSILYGFSGALVVLILVITAARSSRRGYESFALAGLLLGLMPLIHIHTLIAMGIVCAVLATRWRHRGWLITLAVTIVVAAPRMATLLTGPHGSALDANLFPTIEPGWMYLPGADRPLLSVGSLVGGIGGLVRAMLTPQYWSFWVENTGVALPLCVVVAIAVALARLPGRIGAAARRVMSLFPRDLLHVALAFLAVFAVANLVVFQSWDWDNTKLFAYWYLGAALLIATLVVRWWRRWWRGAVAAVVVSTVLLTGILVLVRLLPWTPIADSAGGPYAIATADDVRLAAQVAAATPSNAVFLTESKLNDPVLTLAGRTAVMGYYGWLWSYGTDFGFRVQDVSTMLEGCPSQPRPYCPVFGLLRMYNVDFVEIDDRTSATGVIDTKVDVVWWASQGFAVVARSADITVYDVRAP
jgi:hypothetical protein